MIRLMVPERFEGGRGAGQWKDLQGIRQVLDTLGTEWSEFRFDGTNAGDLAALVGASDDAVIWYYTFWPEALEDLRRRCPRVRIVLRTVNAEALQHWTRAAKDWRRVRGLPRDLYGVFRLLARDRRCARAADVLAGISAWDDAHYWRRLGGRDKVRTVPYLCPWPALLPEIRPQPWAEREPIIACLAGARDPIGRGHVEGFAALARHPVLADWRMVSSDGLMGASRDPLPATIERIGCIDEPWEWLCRVKAVAVLSSRGHGWKTTVTDALAAGCHVWVHPRQHARLPAAERERTIPVDPDSEEDVRRAVVCSREPPATGPEAEIRRQLAEAVELWKLALGGTLTGSTP